MADWGSIFSGGAGGAAGGALAGGVIGGPWGAAIGAGAGGLLGGYSGYVQGKANEKQNKAFEDARKRLAEMQRALYAQRMQNLNQAMTYFDPYLDRAAMLTARRVETPKFSTDLPAGLPNQQKWF